MSLSSHDGRRDSKISVASVRHPSSVGSGAITPMNLEEGPAEEVDLSKFGVAFGDDLYNSNTPENRRLLWKQDIRIVPLSAFISLLCYLDRSNIGNARIMNTETGDDLETELKITDEQYVISLMLFLIAYALFEVPSNYYLKLMTPSKWIAFLMMSWGAITTGTGGVKNFPGLMITRFLLGVFEAGLFPGLVYYLTFWYRSDERSLRVAIIMASSTLAGAFGGAIAYGIAFMNQAQELTGWRWLFILEGIPSCLSAIAVWFWLPDYPETADWLTCDEAHLAVQRLAYNGSKGSSASMTWAEARATLMDWRLYVHYLIYFTMSVSFSSLSLFTPSIVNGLGYSSLQAQLMTIPPWAVSYVFTILIAFTSDHYNARALNSAGCMILGAIGFLVSAILPPERYLARYGCFILACSGSFACIAPLLGWLSGNLHSTSAAGLAIALNVSFGAPGQIVGVWIYRKEEQAGGYPTGHWVNVGMLVLGAAASLMLRAWYKAENARIRKEGRNDRPLWKL
ncbi:MFS general substrate transporter [Wilcoxina mikolae CBS 423.85]|nr:MFS general substrate transporter [Wilcoxina mikolae CBS 423.85]